MTKALRIRIESLTKFLIYVLSHRPDEFGILPDEHGFVKIKELVKALNQEPGWSHVRVSSINEIVVNDSGNHFELKENSIRAKDRFWNIKESYPGEEIPTILFTPVRRRAHRHVFERGLSASPGTKIILSDRKEFAKRLGIRRDNNPVVLEIMAERAISRGVRFYRFGQLYLADTVPKEYIAGPVPPPESKKESEKTKKKKEKAALGGSFILDAERLKDYRGLPKGKKKKGWKEKARKLRRRR